MSQPLQIGDRVIIRVGKNSAMADLNGKLGYVAKIKPDANWPIGVAVDGRMDVLYFKEHTELEAVGDDACPTMEQLRSQEGM